MSAERETVLVIDDSAFVIDALEELLHGAGYEVRRATNGAAGVAAATETPPHLILLDVQMPQMDGWEACAHLKAIESTRDIPIIFMTGAHTAPADVARGLELGATDYVTKPFHEAVLIQRVNAAMRGYRAQREQRRLAEARAEALAALANATIHGTEARRRTELAILAGGMAAETSAPIGAAVERLERLREAVDDRARAELDAVVGDLRRAMAMIDRVRRIGADASSASSASVGEVARAVVAPMAAALERESLRVVQELGETPQVRGATRLAPVLSELVGNAARAVAPGGSIRVETRGEDGWAVLVVEDDGCGMQQLPRSPAAALEGNTAAGTGRPKLGLAMCRAIVGSLGGALEIDSRPGSGTRVIVRLPGAAPVEAVG